MDVTVGEAFHCIDASPSKQADVKREGIPLFLVRRTETGNVQKKSGMSLFRPRAEFESSVGQRHWLAVVRGRLRRLSNGRYGVQLLKTGDDPGEGYGLVKLHFETDTDDT